MNTLNNISKSVGLIFIKFGIPKTPSNLRSDSEFLP